MSFGNSSLHILADVALEDAAIQEQRRKVEATFRCMLTGEVMTNPVVHPNPFFEGRSFQNGPALQERIRTDPKFMLKPGQILIPNPFLLDLINRYKRMYPRPVGW